VSSKPPAARSLLIRNSIDCPTILSLNPATRPKGYRHVFPTTRATNAFRRGISRRKVLQSALAVGATISVPTILRAAPPVIRYATAGGLGPNETIIFTEYMRKNVSKRIDKDYTLDVTYIRVTPTRRTAAISARSTSSCRATTCSPPTTAM
jgi:hypothetical protein